jgi:DNA-binding transcriptional regulator YiaG
MNTIFIRLAWFFESMARRLDEALNGCRVGWLGCFSAAFRPKFDPEGELWGFWGAALCDIPRGQVTARKRLPAIVRKLRAWREKNGLSQAQAVAVLKRASLQTSVSSWEKWEMGLRQPAPLSIPTLEAFLDKHPVVTNPPRSAPRRRKK